jgi:GrpB-like predicted nucleotidyltransferase (UPF0157 family)
MIGLRRHTLRLVDHDPSWAQLAAEACRCIRDAAGDRILDVQHVGSTAVPDLPAKPILDLAAAVTTLAIMPQLVERLTAIGYIYRGDEADAGGHLFVWESEPDVRAIHLHVVASDDVQWRNYIRFRDVLRQNSHLRASYAGLKQKLWARFPDDRESYTQSKHDFIRGVLNGKA